MKRGTLAILIILLVALGAAGLSVWYHYRNQRRAQEFWGPATAQLIDHAAAVEVLALGEPVEGLSLADDSTEAPQTEEKPAEGDAAPPLKAVEFDQTPWTVVAAKDAAGAKGLANLRRSLVLDGAFDWSSPASEAPPRWQYGMSVNDGRTWATVLFDFDSRQVGLTGGRKTALLAPEANDDFRRFFAEQFPPEDKDATHNQPEARESVK
jgi:hypothetical protein